MSAQIGAVSLFCRVGGQAVNGRVLVVVCSVGWVSGDCKLVCLSLSQLVDV